MSALATDSLLDRAFAALERSRILLEQTRPLVEPFGLAPGAGPKRRARAAEDPAAQSGRKRNPSDAAGALREPR